MKTTLILVGKTANKMYETGIRDYEERINHYIPFSIKVIPELKNNKNLSENQQKEKEGELILKSIENKSTVILLDEHGKEYRSIEFAEQIRKSMISGGKDVVFVIGGAYGFSDAVYSRCDGKISLSRMTFSHQMVRVIFAEQLYRAFTIIRGEPYHHE